MFILLVISAYTANMASMLVVSTAAQASFKNFGDAMAARARICMFQGSVAWKMAMTTVTTAAEKVWSGT